MNLEARCDATLSAAPVDDAVPTILVVDDCPMNLALITRILRVDGFNTLAAADGTEALQVCAAAHVDLILLDAMLPGRDGFAVCAELKSNSSTRDIPVIFLSALDDAGSRVAGLGAGGVDFVGKPFDAAEVRARIRVHLQAQRKIASLARAQSARLEELRNAQRSILVLPQDLPEAAFAVYYQPLEAVGGDFYDVLQLGDDSFGYFVADISGHGVGASFLTSAVKALMRQYAGTSSSPEEAMRHINSVLRAAFNDGHYLTACYLQLCRRDMRLAVVNAGHPPLIHVSADGCANRIQAEGDALGIFGNVILQKQEVDVRPGDRLYLYTDGLIESQPGGARARGLDALVSACVRRRTLSLEESLPAILDDVKSADQRVDDDLLLLGVEVRP